MFGRRAFIKGAALMSGGFGTAKTQGFNNPVAARFAAGGTIINKTGLFIYSGTPAFGNLVASDTNPLAATGQTDQFGNAWIPGNVSYQAGAHAIQIAGTSIATWFATVAYSGPWIKSTAFTPIGMAIDGLLTSPIQIGSPIAGKVVIYSETLDSTGVTDYTNLSTYLNNGASVILTQGSYFLSQPLTWSGTELAGSGDSTVIEPGSSWASGLVGILQPGSDAQVRNLRGYGSSNTRSANPVAHFIQVQTGAKFWKVCDIRCDYMYGLAILCAPATGSHGTIRNIKGEHNGGGISIDNGTAANVTAEINISDIDIQNCETNPVFYISDVTDVLMSGPMNGSILAGANVIGVHVVGSCQTCFLFGLDVGGGSGAGMLVFDSNATGSPTEIEVGPGTLQQGQAGIVINAGSRLAFTHVWAKSNQGDGWTIAGTTGAGIVMTGCGGNGNNAGAGVAYDVDVTTTSAHVLNQGFRYISPAVTAGRFLVAANHYTEGFPPAAMTNAGAAPGGW
jgi:hypothetical protein